MVSQGQGFLNTQWWLARVPGRGDSPDGGRVQPARRRAAPGARPAAGDAVIAVRDLEIAFGERVVARVPELDLPRGAIVGLAGESGSGKSMTALAILGLASHAGARVRGSIRLDGEELAGRPERELRRIRGRRIAMVMQSPARRAQPDPAARDAVRPDAAHARRRVRGARGADPRRGRRGPARRGRAAPLPARGVRAARRSGSRSRWPSRCARTCSSPTSRRARST